MFLFVEGKSGRIQHLCTFATKKTHRLCWGCFFFKLQAKTFLLWTFVQFAQSSLVFCENTTESLAYFQVITNKIHSKNQKKKFPTNHPASSIIHQHLHQDSCSLGSDCPSSSVCFKKSGSEKKTPVKQPKPQKKMLWLSEVKVSEFFNASVKTHPQYESNKPQNFVKKYDRISPCHVFCI